MSQANRHSIIIIIYGITEKVDGGHGKLKRNTQKICCSNMFLFFVFFIQAWFHSLNRTIWPPSVGGHPNVHFRFWHCRDSNPISRNLNKKYRRLNDIGHPDLQMLIFTQTRLYSMSQIYLSFQVQIHLL